MYNCQQNYVTLEKFDCSLKIMFCMGTVGNAVGVETPFVLLLLILSMSSSQCACVVYCTLVVCSYHNSQEACVKQI